MKVSRADLFRPRRVVGRPKEVHVSTKYSRNRYKFQSKTRLDRDEYNRLVVRQIEKDIQNPHLVTLVGITI